MGRFRKRPVEIEAVQYTGDNYDEVSGFVGSDCIYIANSNGRGERVVRIRTLEGHMRVSVGDWVIRGVRGEVYPCKPDIFDQTYEPVAGRVGG